MVVNQRFPKGAFESGNNYQLFSAGRILAGRVSGDGSIANTIARDNPFERGVVPHPAGRRAPADRALMRGPESDLDPVDQPPGIPTARQIPLFYLLKPVELSDRFN